MEPLLDEADILPKFEPIVGYSTVQKLERKER